MISLLPLLLACSGSAPVLGPARLGTPEELGPADAVGAADLDGDGADSLVLVHDGIARWDGNEQELGAIVQAVARGDVDGDGLEELILACGMGRGQPRAPARLWLLDAGGARLVWEREGQRNQITELQVLAEGPWMAAFADGKRVEGGWLRPAEPTWTFEPLHVAAMATRQLPVAGGVLAGRVYGDEPRSDGDLALFVGEQRTQLPTLRGVRSLALADLDGDGVAELLVGDGWHYKYGTEARARLRMLRGADWQRGRAVASFDDEFTVREIEVVGTGPDAWLLATGSSRAHVLVRDGLGWQDLPVGSVGETGNAVVAHRPGGAGVLLSGDPARWIPVQR
jgi:hypothetical protein